jgi:hypothetical protein
MIIRFILTFEYNFSIFLLLQDLRLRIARGVETGEAHAKGNIISNY